jgi:peptidyl-prolyl cis-trans isomerase B (cyclophilin B)
MPMHWRTVWIIALAAVVLGTGGCAPEASDGPDQMHSSAPYDTASVATAAPETQEESMLHVSETAVSGSEIGVIQTSKGTVKVEFYPADAPNTVASFIELADAGFYDGLKFHRVVPRFVVQGGDPLTRTLTTQDVQAGVGGVGTGGPGWNQRAEFNDRKHVVGTLAMARSQHPDSAGSQFYICLEPQPSLDGQYTVFGQVIEGMDVVSTIQVGDVIESITIER